MKLWATKENRPENNEIAQRISNRHIKRLGYISALLGILCFSLFVV